MIAPMPVPPRESREFDVVLQGATGFTGRLVAEHFLRVYGASGDLRWALSGRDAAKLERVRDEVGRETGVDASSLELIVGDGSDDAAMNALAERTRVVCTTVGPYAKYGSPLAAACAAAGTDYCDLAGEVQWMRRMIDAHQATAEASGARLVPASGFDSIPSDLGTWFVQREMQRRHGVFAKRVSARVKGFSGGASGGTIASMVHMLEEASADPTLRKLMGDPYALRPAGAARGADRNEALAPVWDDDFGQWVGPFVMAAINTRIVRRSAALIEGGYGEGFGYDEGMLLGKGPAGWARAAATGAGMGATMATMSIDPLRRLIAPRLPAPGTGPDKKTREAGYWDLRFFAEHPTDPGKSLRAKVTGQGDPGYGSTSRMLGESAVCLAKDELGVAGGFWTPASAMGDALLERLEANAGVAFEVLPD